MKKSDEREFLFGIKICTNLELPVLVTGVSQDLLVVGPLLLVVCQLINRMLRRWRGRITPFFAEGG
jgi:hypothetical protein